MKNLNSHSDKCKYSDDDLLLYAYLNLFDDKYSLISANELDLFDKYLDYAKNDDKSIVIDMEANEDVPYKLVYGGIMIKDEISFDSIKEYIEKNKGCALIDLDSESNGHLIASVYDDIKIYIDEDSEKFVPFVALMKTHHVLHDEEISITMFPYCGGLVWEDMINKPCLLACRETVQIADLTENNWKTFIDETLLHDIFKVADLYTPK